MSAGLLEQLIPGEARTTGYWCTTCERFPGMAHTCVEVDAENHLRVKP